MPHIADRKRCPFMRWAGPPAWRVAERRGARTVVVAAAGPAIASDPIELHRRRGDEPIRGVCGA